MAFVSLWLVVVAAVVFADGRPSVVDAAKRGDRETLQALVRARADVNVSEPDGSTALHWAVEGDDLETLDLLIQAGANVKAQDRYGRAPLYYACANSNAVLVEHRKLDPEVPLLLLQVDAVESAFHILAPSRPSRFRRLQDHLLRFYPPNHIITNIRSASYPIFEPELIHFEVQNLGNEFADKKLGGTVYLPPAKHAEFDESLAREIYDPLHVNRISFPQG